MITRMGMLQNSVWSVTGRSFIISKIVGDLKKGDCLLRKAG